MKPVLVLALGNSLAGDDAAGLELATLAAADPDISSHAEVIHAGTDIFRHAHLLAGRHRVVLVDAALKSGGGVAIRLLSHPLPTAERRPNAHALDPVAAVQLLRSVIPELAAAEIWWLLIELPSVALGVGLSPAARDALPPALAALREVVLRALPA